MLSRVAGRDLARPAPVLTSPAAGPPWPPVTAGRRELDWRRTAGHRQLEDGRDRAAPGKSLGFAQLLRGSVTISTPGAHESRRGRRPPFQTGTCQFHSRSGLLCCRCARRIDFSTTYLARDLARPPGGTLYPGRGRRPGDQVTTRAEPAPSGSRTARHPDDSPAGGWPGQRGAGVTVSALVSSELVKAVAITGGERTMSTSSQPEHDPAGPALDVVMREQPHLVNLTYRRTEAPRRQSGSGPDERGRSIGRYLGSWNRECTGRIFVRGAGSDATLKRTSQAALRLGHTRRNTMTMVTFEACGGTPRNHLATSLWRPALTMRSRRLPFRPTVLSRTPVREAQAGDQDFAL